MGMTADEAERMASDILYKNDSVMAISIMDMKGNILASNSTHSFKKAFGTISKKDEEYAPSLAIAMLVLANQVKDIFGEAHAVIAVFKHCKTVLLPSQTDQVMLGLVLERSANIEDFLIAEDKGVEALILREHKT